MDRSQKADLVDELKQVFNETSVVVVTRNLGLTVAQSTDPAVEDVMRGELKLEL